MADRKDNTPDEAEQLENENPEQLWVTDESLVDLSNLRWREVIEKLMNGKTITEAYGAAYDIDIKHPHKYSIAASNGSRLLKNDKFKRLWRKVIEERGFNDEAVDWALTDLITNPEVEPTVRRAAIKDYNELLGRIVKNFDIKSGGKPLQSPPVFASPIEPRNVEPQADTTEGN